MPFVVPGLSCLSFQALGRHFQAKFRKGSRRVALMYHSIKWRRILVAFRRRRVERVLGQSEAIPAGRAASAASASTARRSRPPTACRSDRALAYRRAARPLLLAQPFVEKRVRLALERVDGIGRVGDFLGLRRFLGLDRLLLHDLRILRPILARGRYRDAASRLRKGFRIGREQKRRPLGHLDVGLLAVARQAHIVEHLALELDAATAAKRKRSGESRRQKRRPAGARNGCYCAPRFPLERPRLRAFLHLRRVSDLFVTPE